MIIIKNTWIEDKVKFKEEMIKWILQLIHFNFAKILLTV